MIRDERISPAPGPRSPVPASRLLDHKFLSLLYGGTAGAFLLVGFLLMLLLRWQLAWPGQPIGVATAIFGQTNAPGGILLPEFYYQLVSMHGSVMIFLAVVPLATNGFGGYLVPLQIGAAGAAFPRLSALGYGLYLAAGLLMLASFVLPGGAANSGWTAYPPLASIAGPGQTWWLAGIFLLGVSAMLGAVNLLATVVAGRARGLMLLRMPFFVWAQVVTALLLLLAFPALQAAAVFQWMDRVVGTSFFLPSGLAVSNTPLDVAGGGNPLLWQHLFWFLAHPEVYVLVLPAMGIVAEVITAHARRPLWRYGLMVNAVAALGGWSLVVWAHHMFLTGMGTTLSSFFQVTTMVVSVPSVIVLTCLVITLWGGAIRFTTAMLFALAFLPMFGLGGVTGLPLGLGPSNVVLHDTFYVVGHFHYLVAPGTLFALFAGVYHWFPKLTGRRLGERLGLVHFAGSFVCMNAVFLPMFLMGLSGVNRRMYDAAAGSALAQPTLGWNAHMTSAAVALGLFQLVFLWNIHWSARRGTPAENPWQATTLEWTTGSPPPPGNFLTEPIVSGPPYRYDGETA